MKTIGLRLYGKNDLRLEEFELPEINDDEILATVVSDTMCMSSWKLLTEGENHKKTPSNLADNPVVIGHEFSGTILKVGAKWADQYAAGDNFVVQPNLARDDTPFVPGYSYRNIGGDATTIIIPPEVMELGCLIPVHNMTFYEGSLCEPLSCVIGAFEAQYHVIPHTNKHEMGIKIGGNTLILGGTGPMGLLAIDYALHADRKPKNLVVTGLKEATLERLRKLYTSDEVNITFVNVKNLSVEDQEAKLREVVDGDGYDDVFAMITIAPLIEMAGRLLNSDACLNLFAGPTDKSFSAMLNFYDVHYNFIHVVGTSGGTAENEREAVELMSSKRVDVAKVVTHVLGLNAAAETTMHQREIGGGKKLTYTHKAFDRIELASVDPATPLGEILARHDGVWSQEAEQWILENKPDIEAPATSDVKEKATA